MEKSQADKILSHLRTGLPLTPAEAYRRYGCLRLAARIFELRQAGYDVRDDLIPVDTQHGGVAHVAAYYMVKQGELF